MDSFLETIKQYWEAAKETVISWWETGKESFLGLDTTMRILLVAGIALVLLLLLQLANGHRSKKQLKMLGSIDRKLDGLQETAQAAAAAPGEELSYEAYMEKYFFGKDEPFYEEAAIPPAAPEVKEGPIPVPVAEEPVPEPLEEIVPEPAEEVPVPAAEIPEPVREPVPEDAVSFAWTIPTENPFPDAQPNDLSAFLKEVPDEQPVTTVEEILAGAKKEDPAGTYFKPRAFDIANTGRSGRQYTITELESQIRE